MGLLETLLIAVGLAMDAFAVSLGIGTTGRATSAGARSRLALGFGFFQFAMPLIGWFAGTRVADLIGGFDHWLAFGLLAFVGGRMVRSGLDTEAEPEQGDPSRGRTWLVLCIATSIDALAVGLSFAMLHTGILQPAAIIGVVTAAISLAGLLLGAKLGEVLGKRAELVGGLVLIGIGLRVLISHLTGG
jgi:manganese efflux pump family protein